MSGLLAEVPVRVTAADVVEAIRRSFGSDRGYVTIPEVQVGQSGRRCDVVALQMYRSRGIHLHGFEVKVDRRDWLRELKDAAKADELAQHCRYWTVVAPPGVIDVTEVPEPWGYSECRGSDGRLFVVRRPPENPEVVTVGLATAARLISRAVEGARKPGEDALREAREGEYRRGVEAGRDAERRVSSIAAEEVDLLRRLELASGMSIGTWNVDRLGAILRATANHEDPVGEARRTLTRLRERVDGWIGDLPEVTPR